MIKHRHAFCNLLCVAEVAAWGNGCGNERLQGDCSVSDYAGLPYDTPRPPPSMLPGGVQPATTLQDHEGGSAIERMCDMGPRLAQLYTVSKPLSSTLFISLRVTARQDTYLIPVQASKCARKTLAVHR